MVVEQDVSIRLQHVLMLSLGVGLSLQSGMSCFISSWEPLCFEGTPSNFLVLRIKVHKTIRVSHALWGSASTGKDILKRGFCPINTIINTKQRVVVLKSILPHRQL